MYINFSSNFLYYKFRLEFFYVNLKKISFKQGESKFEMIILIIELKRKRDISIIYKFTKVIHNISLFHRQQSISPFVESAVKNLDLCLNNLIILSSTSNIN